MVCPAESLPFEGQCGQLSDSILTGTRGLESTSSSIPLKLSLELVRAAGEEFQAGATGSRLLTIRDDIIADDWTG
jgi:hypothetical protein